jgi:hypothetical protein
MSPAAAITGSDPVGDDVLGVGDGVLVLVGLGLGLGDGV